MAVDPALTLSQWFSTGFPVGGFSYSHGLEWLIETGEISTAADLAQWVEAILKDGSGRTDAIFVACGFAATSDEELEALDALCMAYCSARGRRTETEEQGAAFARTLREMGLRPLPGLAYPVAVGRAALLNDLPLEITLRHYLHGFAANLVSAAVRRVPLGQSDGQKVLAGTHPLIQKLANDTLPLGPQDIYSNTFMAEITAMQHETLRSKVFRT